MVVVVVVVVALFVSIESYSYCRDLLLAIPTPAHRTTSTIPITATVSLVSMMNSYHYQLH